MSDPIFRAVAGAVVLLYLAAALFIPLAAIDALYLPDDTYYTLTIARNIAAGLGPTTDGVIQTTGFQPLIALLLQPVFWLGLEGDAALRAAIVFSASFGAGAVILAGLIARQATGAVGAGVLTLILAGVSSPVFVNSMNGLETTLAGFFALLLVLLASATTDENGPGRLILIGVVAGLALWARIDAALLILVLLPVAIWRLGPRGTLIVAGAAVVTISPWVIYCLAQTGEPLPESGDAVRQIVAFYAATGRESFQNVEDMGKAMGRVLALKLPGEIRMLLPVLLLMPLLQAVRRRRMDGVAILAAATLVMMFFYVFYLPAFWFFHRYMFWGGLVLVIVFVVTFWPLLHRARYLPAVVVVLALGGQHAVTFWDEARVWTGRMVAFYAGHNYGAVGQLLMPQVPEGSIVVAMQSGALSWYAPEGVRVVNLDGVVNGEAQQAILDGTLDLYIRDLGATHFADWPFNQLWLNERSTAPVAMTEVDHYDDHQREGLHFTLYTLD